MFSSCFFSSPQPHVVRQRPEGKFESVISISELEGMWKFDMKTRICIESFISGIILRILYFMKFCLYDLVKTLTADRNDTWK